MLKSPLLRSSTWTATLVLLAGCDGEAPTGPVHDTVITTGAMSPMVTKPIKGTWDNTESPPTADPPDGCIVHIETSQAGNATHLGRFEGTGATCATSAEVTESPPFWDHKPAPPYFVADFTNEMVWVAANGDELWLRPNGGVFVQSLANGAASVRAQITIAGGTGRFVDASGWMSVTGGREPGEPGDHLLYEGEITLKSGARGQSS